MSTEILIELFERDMDRLIKEVNEYEREEDLWIKSDGISNSAGNLFLHIIGNLNHFIGSVLGGTKYVRNREAEFTSKDVLLADMIEMARGTRNMIVIALRTIKDDELNEKYPIEVFGHEMTKNYFLVHLLGHLNYHLGQINYHRRLLTLSK